MLIKVVFYFTTKLYYTMQNFYWVQLTTLLSGVLLVEIFVGLRAMGPSPRAQIFIVAGKIKFREVYGLTKLELSSQHT